MLRLSSLEAAKRLLQLGIMRVSVGLGNTTLRGRALWLVALVFAGGAAFDA